MVGAESVAGGIAGTGKRERRETHAKARVEDLSRARVVFAYFAGSWNLLPAELLSC
jgi:hypothetical protein